VPVLGLHEHGPHLGPLRRLHRCSQASTRHHTA
jgi:hypothetical protein